MYIGHLNVKESIFVCESKNDDDDDDRIKDFIRFFFLALIIQLNSSQWIHIDNWIIIIKRKRNEFSK